MGNRIARVCLIACLFASVTALAGCSPNNGENWVPDVGGGDADGGGADADVSPESDWTPPDTIATDGDVLPEVITIRESSDPRCPIASYIWIANSEEGTLSKVCTRNGLELSRFRTCPYSGAGVSFCDPSRTSVNMHGDMVVTNREPYRESSGENFPSSVTKFAAEWDSCTSDWNDNSEVDTANGGTATSPKGWEQDDCMIWNTELESETIGARATAWDGQEDPETGEGGTIWIGAANNQRIYQLDGDTGEILYEAPVEIEPYGGAMDLEGANFWIVAYWACAGGNWGECELAKVNTTTHDVDYYTTGCGYGITVDSDGIVWTSGQYYNGAEGHGSCISRFDPASETWEAYDHPAQAADYFYRGLAADNAGYLWVANTNGQVLKFNKEDMDVEATINLGQGMIVGMAIDYEEMIWAVNYNIGDTGNAIKIDPSDNSFDVYPVGLGSYTYSDMTGYQLMHVIWIQ